MHFICRWGYIEVTYVPLFYAEVPAHQGDVFLEFVVDYDAYDGSDNASAYCAEQQCRFFFMVEKAHHGYKQGYRQAYQDGSAPGADY